MPWPEVALQCGPTSFGDSAHHPVGTNGDNTVDLGQRDPHLAKCTRAVRLDRLYDIADEGFVVCSAWREARCLVAAPDDAVGGALDIGDLVAILDRLVAGEIQYAGAFGPERRAD